MLFDGGQDIGLWIVALLALGGICTIVFSKRTDTRAIGLLLIVIALFVTVGVINTARHHSKTHRDRRDLRSAHFTVQDINSVQNHASLKPSKKSDCALPFKLMTIDGRRTPFVKIGKKDKPITREKLDAMCAIVEK